MSQGLEQKEDGYQEDIVPTYLLPRGEDVFQDNLRMLISHFQTHEVASISVNTDPNNQYIGVHLKKVESQTDINPQECVLLIDKGVYESFRFLSSQNFLIPGLRSSAEKHHIRLKENTELIWEIQTNIQ